MKKLLLVLPFLIVNLNLFSQDSTLIYLNDTFEQTSKDSATLIRKAVVKGKQICITDMKTDGSKIIYCEFMSLNPKVENGKAIYYKDHDSIYCTGNYRLGQMVGEWIYYDRAKSGDTVNYSFINNCASKDLRKVPYYLNESNKSIEIGGKIIDSLPSFIAANFHMPARARYDGVNSVYQMIECVVGSEGKINCPNIKNSIHPDIDREIYRILSLFQYKAEIRKPFIIPPVYFSYVFSNDENMDLNDIFTFADEMPVFPGGDIALLTFISENLMYPEVARDNNIQGKVIVRFYVSKYGRVEHLSIAKGVAPSLDAEAFRVVSLLPAFTPGKNKGKPVNVWYSLPIAFQMTTIGNR